MLWGSAAPCVKRGYELFAVSADAPFSQLVFAGWRFALAGILVLLVTRLKGHRIVPKRDEIKPILAISLFQSMLQYVCYYIGLSGTTGHQRLGALRHADVFCAAAGALPAAE